MLNEFHYDEAVSGDAEIMEILRNQESIIQLQILQTSLLVWKNLEADMFSLYKRDQDTNSDQLIVSLHKDSIYSMTTEQWAERIRKEELDNSEINMRHQVIDRIADWIKRLDVLYDRILEMDTGEWTVDRNSQLQVVEELMKKFEVQPRKVPTLTIYDTNRGRFSFVPSGIWVVGAFGRINFVTNNRQFMLVDRRQTFLQPSNWMICDTRSRNNLYQFNEDVFRVILGGGEL